MATILIVDDNAVNRAFLVTLLGYGNHRMLEAGDGVEGLKAMHAAHPDLVISDILMPHMDGHEFVTRVHADASLAATPIIFYTAGYHEAEARVIARACGVTRVLAKPAEPEVILRTVDEALGLPARNIALPALTAPPEEGSRFSTIGNQLAEYLVELESSSQLIERLVERPDSMQEQGPERAVTTKRLATSLLNLQAASARLSDLMRISQEIATEATTGHDPDPVEPFTPASPPRHAVAIVGRRIPVPKSVVSHPIQIGPRVTGERSKFQARLSKALHFAGYPYDSPTQLAHEFNFRFSGKPVTIHAARKWLVGESIPTQDKLRILAQWLGVTAEWLRFGDVDHTGAERMTNQVPAASSEEGRLLAELQELDPYHRKLAQDFVTMLAEKHAAESRAPRRGGKSRLKNESISLD